MRQLGTVIINVLFWGFFVVSSSVLLIGAAAIRILTAPFDRNQRILQKYSCFWSSLYVWFNPFWSVKVTGYEHVDPRQAYVMVSNHSSMADILVLFRSFLHFKWVSKKSMFKVPLLGWNMWLNGYVSIDRGDAESREKCLADCRDWIQKGSSVFFFPEGTRSKDGKMKAFKIGAFRVAAETGAPILPMVIRGSRDAIPKHSILLSRKSKMSLEILPPIPVEKVAPEQVTDLATQLAESSHQLIESAFLSEN